jgi:hypothetical protein
VKFKATYARWLRTHDRSHPEYHNRKAFPWHILSRVDFDPSDIGTKVEVCNKDQMYLGSVSLDVYQYREDDQRHQFDVTTSDARSGHILQFRLVFLGSGKLITIHSLGKDQDAKVVRQFLAGNYSLFDSRPSRKLAKAILLEAVTRFQKRSGEFDKFGRYVPYSGTEIAASFQLKAQEVGRTLKMRSTYTVDLSSGRKLWLIFSLFEYEAHAVTYKYAHQCDKLVSIFLSESQTIPYPCPFENSNISSVYEYFDWSDSRDLEARLRVLEGRVLCYQKYP